MKLDTNIDFSCICDLWRVSVLIPCSRMIIITTETQTLIRVAKIELKKKKKQTVKMELSISPLQPDSNLISEKKQKPEWIISLFSLYHTAADGWNTVLGETKPLHHTSDCINRKHFNRETVK